MKKYLTLVSISIKKTTTIKKLKYTEFKNSHITKFFKDMKKYIVVLFLLLGSIFFNCTAQNITLNSSSDRFDVYQTVSLEEYQNILDEKIESSAALRYFLIQEITKDDAIYSIDRTVENGKQTFFIQAQRGLTTQEVDAKIIAAVIKANETLLGYLQDEGYTAYELSNFIKSNLIVD